MAETNRQTEIGKVPRWAKQCLVGVMPDLVRFLSGHARRKPLWQPASACWGAVFRGITRLYRPWIRALLTEGYVVLAVDSTTSRGFGQTCSPGADRTIMWRDRPKDAYAALQCLQAQPFADAVLRVLAFLKARLD
jgi:hypothetical protein